MAHSTGGSAAQAFVRLSRSDKRRLRRAEEAPGPKDSGGPDEGPDLLFHNFFLSFPNDFIGDPFWIE